MKAVYNLPVRMIIGAALNIILLLMSPRLAVWSSDEREFRLALLSSTIGTIGVIALLPVLWLGKGWQPVVGLLLLALPCLSFWPAFEFVLKNK